MVSKLQQHPWTKLEHLNDVGPLPFWLPEVSSTRADLPQCNAIAQKRAPQLCIAPALAGHMASSLRDILWWRAKPQSAFLRQGFP